MLIVSVVVYGIWSSDKNNLSIELGNKMYKVISADLSPKEQERLLNEIAQHNHDYKYIAQLKLADVLMQQAKVDDAVRLYNELKRNEKVVQYISDLAEQRLILIDSDEKAMRGNIFYFSNIFLQAIKTADSKISGDMLQSLVDNFETPVTLKELAREVNSLSD